MLLHKTIGTKSLTAYVLLPERWRGDDRHESAASNSVCRVHWYHFIFTNRLYHSRQLDRDRAGCDEDSHQPAGYADLHLLPGRGPGTDLHHLRPDADVCQQRGPADSGL